MRNRGNKALFLQTQLRMGEGDDMRKLAFLLLAGIFGIIAQASAQAPAQAPAQPKPSTTPKAGAPTARAYDRALLRPALLKDKAPDTFQVKFITTRGVFTVTVSRARAPLAAARCY